MRRLKGKKPAFGISTRPFEALAALECVSYVVNFEEDTPLALIEKVKPDVLVKGADYKIDEIVGANTVISNGGQVKTIEFVDGLSTSKLIERIKSNASVLDSDNSLE